MAAVESFNNFFIYYVFWRHFGLVSIKTSTGWRQIKEIPDMNYDLINNLAALWHGKEPMRKLPAACHETHS